MSYKTEISCISDLMFNDLVYASLKEAIKNGVRIIEENNDIKVYSNDVEGQLFIIANDLDTYVRNEPDIDYYDYYIIFTYNKDIHEYLLKKNRGIKDIGAYYQCQYLKKEKIDTINNDFRRLDTSYLDIILKKYEYLTKEEAFERLNSGNIFGLFIDNIIVGFIGLHREGQMGMLRVFDKYKRKGYAFDLEGHLINYLIDHDRNILCEVLADNYASIKLQKKLGLKVSENLQYWLLNGE